MQGKTPGNVKKEKLKTDPELVPCGILAYTMLKTHKNLVNQQEQGLPANLDNLRTTMHRVPESWGCPPAVSMHCTEIYTKNGCDLYYIYYFAIIRVELHKISTSHLYCL